MSHNCHLWHLGVSTSTQAFSSPLLQDSKHDALCWKSEALWRKSISNHNPLIPLVSKSTKMWKASVSLAACLSRTSPTFEKDLWRPLLRRTSETHLATAPGCCCCGRTKISFSNWKSSWMRWSLPEATFLIFSVQSRKLLFNGADGLNNDSLFLSNALWASLSFLVFFILQNTHFVFLSNQLALFHYISA